jgi:hypothetical protein
MEGWEVRVLGIEVFIVFLGFDLASWFPGPGGGAGWWGGHDCALLDERKSSMTSDNKPTPLSDAM